MVFVAASVNSQTTFTLQDVIQRAQSQSPIFKITETRLQNRYWQYRTFRTNYNPQLRLNNQNAGTLYVNSISRVPQNDGTIDYLRQNNFNPGFNFALQQPIQWTGGTVFLNSGYNYINNILKNKTQWNGAPMNLQINQPVLAYNKLKWDRKIEPIKYEESKRDYAESMEQISRDASGFFFTVLQEQVNLQIARFNLANNDTIYKIEKGRYNIGTTSEDKLLQVELQLLRSRQDVAQANLNLQKASLDLRTYIGIRAGESFELVMPDSIPAFKVDEEEAVEFAKKTRSAFIAFERRKIEAKSAVAQARGGLYSVSINAGYGLNNVGTDFSDTYQNLTPSKFATISVDIPIVDWGRRRAVMQSAYANKKLQDYLIAQDEVVFEQEILTQVRQFEMLHLQITITKKSDEVALQRYKVAQNRYLIGKIDITNLNIALTEKDNAKRSYIQALKLFWTAYYDLRRLTLYDFEARKYLYNPFQEN